jgi:hypothetical protein
MALSRPAWVGVAAINWGSPFGAGSRELHSWFPAGRANIAVTPWCQRGSDSPGWSTGWLRASWLCAVPVRHPLFVRGAGSRPAVCHLRDHKLDECVVPSGDEALLGGASAQVGFGDAQPCRSGPRTDEGPRPKTVTLSPSEDTPPGYLPVTSRSCRPDLETMKIPSRSALVARSAACDPELRMNQRREKAWRGQLQQPGQPAGARNQCPISWPLEPCVSDSFDRSN